MDRFPSKIDSSFRFVLLASSRAEQMMRGAQPKIDLPASVKPTRVAMEEIFREAIEWDYGKEPVAEDAEPETAGSESN